MVEDQGNGKPNSFIKLLKSWFLTGLLILLPLGITAIIVNWLLNYVGEPLSRCFWNFFGIDTPDKFWMTTIVNLFSTLLVLTLITALGVFSKYFFGKVIIRLVEQLIIKVPFVNTVYKTVKQIVETFGKNQEAVFQKTVLVEYPRKGVYAIGFLTSETKGEVQVKTSETVVNVFLPTTPNPTSGFLLLVPKESVIYLDMSVSDGMKMIISGGVVNPDYPLNGENHN